MDSLQKFSPEARARFEDSFARLRGEFVNLCEIGIAEAERIHAEKIASLRALQTMVSGITTESDMATVLPQFFSIITGDGLAPATTPTATNANN